MAYKNAKSIINNIKVTNVADYVSARQTLMNLTSRVKNGQFECFYNGQWLAESVVEKVFSIDKILKPIVDWKEKVKQKNDFS